MKRRIARYLFAAALALPACGDRSSRDSSQAAADTAAAAAAAVAEAEAEARGLSGNHRDRDDPDWIPAEFKSMGAAMWREPMVYVDGVPVGVLHLGEMPRGFEPVWLEAVELLDFRPGDTGPRERKTKKSRWRIAEYLEGVGFDLAKVNELHIHGGGTFVAAVSGDDFRRFRDDIQFDFTRETEGKIRIFLPEDLETNTSFDRIAGFAVYIDKKPPTVTDEHTLELDGKPVIGVAYYGEPLRGGVRVYLDDRMTAVIKRHELGDVARVEGSTDRHSLLGFLEAQGVDTAAVTRGVVVEFDDRKSRLDRSALEQAFFVAGAQRGGEILLGEDGEVAHALMLYTDSAETAKR